MTITFAPYTRYRASDIEWIAQIPAHWMICPGHSGLKQRREKNIGLKETRVLSLSYGRIVVKPQEKLHGLVPVSFETYQIANPGNIIIRPTDLQNDKNSIRVGLVRNRGIITSAYLCIEARSTLVPEYAYELLRTYDLLKIFYGMGSGLRQNLEFGEIKRMPIIVPPIEEQEAIVRYLGHINRKVNAAIQAKLRLVELVREEMSAVLEGIIGDLTKFAPIVPLKSLCKIQSGITLGKDYTGFRLREYPYIRVANVQAGHLNLSSVKTISLPEIEARRSTLRTGDVLMTEGGDPDKLGRGCVWSGEIDSCVHQNHVFAVRPDPTRLYSKYLTVILGTRAAQNYFFLTSKQTTNLASTNKTTIGVFRFPLPPLEEQQRIVREVEIRSGQYNQIISRTEREISLLREYHTRLTADVVTGKVDVRTVAVALPDDAEPTGASRSEM
jgi:type I restriction enzyme S subunit